MLMPFDIKAFELLVFGAKESRTKAACVEIFTP